MVDSSIIDDLSGNAPAANTGANDSLLLDARARRWLRIGAAIAASMVIVFIGFLLQLTVCAIINDIAHLTVQAVSFVTALLAALALLTIALLRSIFADNGERKDGSPITMPSLELLKAIREAADTAIKGIKGGE